ncbi:MAG: endonuclease/exonuclease/phosphatase family protein [Thermoanaerobaculia bacterium]
MRGKPYPVTGRDRTSGIPAGRSLSVMSYNIQGYGALFSGRYLEGVARVIRRARPDIVGLQEVHRGTWAARFADQVELLARLTGMEACFGRSLTTRTGEYGNALLTRGRAVEVELHQLPGEAERRSLLRCRLEVDGATMDAFVTHLAAWGRLGRTNRTVQARFIAGHLARAERPFVLTGDFNASPGAPELVPLLGNGLLRRCGGREQPTHRLIRQPIDHVATDPGWDVLRVQVLRAGPSDHFPVLATLRRGAARAAAERTERPAPAPAVSIPRAG